MNLLELINKTKTIISDDSYKKYAKYYDLTEPTDNAFNDKIDIIYDLINCPIDDKNLEIEGLKINKDADGKIYFYVK